MSKENPFSGNALEEQAKRRGYKPVRELTKLQRLRDVDYLDEKFLCQDNAGCFNDVTPDKAHIVTGFGPTNAPTGGTLSVIMKARSLMQETGVEMTIIISNVGAWCSRQASPQVIGYYTRRFLDFIDALGIARHGLNLRTHEDVDILAIAGLLTRFLTANDFEENKEATTELYGRLGLLGNQFGVWTDTAYTVADILEPLLRRDKRRVLVLAGIEESYFTELARIALGRMEERYPGVFFKEPVDVGAMYTRLIGGLHPYPKMSKSIPASAMNLENSEAELVGKILDGPKENDPILLQMMVLASDWSASTLKEVRWVFEHRDENTRAWNEHKQRYFEYFLGLKRKWDSLASGPSSSIVSIFPSAARPQET
jgi:tryptophanyl-tRNA synthetase